MASLKRNLLYNFLLSFSQLALPLISIPYVSRVLNPEGIGQVSFIDSFTYYFITIAEFGIMVYGMREIAKVKDDPIKLAKTVSEIIALHVISTLAAMILYVAAAYIVWDEINDTRLLTLSFSFLLINSFACEWYFIGKEKFGYITVRSLIIRLTGLATIFILIKEPGDFWIYYGVMVVSAIINNIWNLIVLFREVKISFRKLNLRRHIKLTWDTYLISLLYSISLLLDNVLLGLVSTAAAVGLYAFAMRMAKTATVVLSDALLVFFPRIVSFIKEGNREGIRATVLNSVRFIIIFSIPISFGLFFLADELILLFLGSKFESAILNLKILSLFPMFRAYNLFLSKQILVAYNREKLYVRTLAYGNALFIILTLVLSSLFDDMGACIAILVAELLMIVLNFRYARNTEPALALLDQRTILQALGSAIIFIPIIALGRYYFDDLLAIVVFSILICTLWYFGSMLWLMKNSFMIVAKNAVRRHLKFSNDGKA